MAVCIVSLAGGYSEALTAWQAGEKKSLQTTWRRRWYPLSKLPI